MAFPDYNESLRNIWGWGDESIGYLPVLALASNILVGTNPPYSTTDFYGWFPTFAGAPVTVQGTLDGITGVITGVSDLTNAATGLYVYGNGIQAGSVIVSVDTGTSSMVISLPTRATGIQAISIYSAAAVPVSILNAYIYLATSSILQVRYQEMWSYCMALYIAHFLTLWLNSQGMPGSTPGQIASSGLAMGVGISQHVGDVSYASTPLKMPDWAGTYALTTYGQQLMTFGMAVGSGPVWLY